jgi:hypothetical protein
MAQVLSAVPLHGLDSVLAAIQIALQAGRVSAEHVLNTLAHLKDQSRPMVAGEVETPLTLQTPPLANMHGQCVAGSIGYGAYQNAGP